MGCGYATAMASTNENDATTKQGPANPQGSEDLDAPTPPGGPQRSDAPGQNARQSQGQPSDDAGSE